MELKSGSIVVCNEELVQHGDIEEGKRVILKDEIREIYMTSSDGKFVWFVDTPPGSGSYRSTNFREATAYEKQLFEKGIRITTPESLFEEGDKVITTEKITCTEGKESIDAETDLVIEDIIKVDDMSKSIVWFENQPGAYRVKGFKKV